jgi:hypothetical protein
VAASIITDAIELLEKANADLEPELLTTQSARRLLDEYSQAEKLALYGKAVLARRVDDVAVVARATGTSMGRAKQTVETGAALKEAPEVSDALARGDVSFDQAGEIAKAELARPGSATELLSVLGFRRSRESLASQIDCAAARSTTAPGTSDLGGRSAGAGLSPDVDVPLDGKPIDRCELIGLEREVLQSAEIVLELSHAARSDQCRGHARIA